MYEYNLFHASFTLAIKANLVLGLAVHFQLTTMKGLAFGGKEFDYHYLVKMFAFCRLCKKQWQVWSRDLWDCAPGRNASVSSCPVTQHTSCSMWMRKKLCLEFDYTRQQKVHSSFQLSLFPVIWGQFWGRLCWRLSIGVINLTFRSRDDN